MNKIQSNPTSRSPSRVASHRAHSQPSTPGLIHLSPAMLQSAQPTSAGKGGKRSKGASQRNVKNSKGSSKQHTADEGTATGSDADIFMDPQGQEAGKPRTPTPSIKRERRQQRQQEYSADGTIEDGSLAKGRHAEATATPDLPIQRATTPRRPKHKRGQSQATFAAPEAEEHSYQPAMDDQASLLSKSAPITSFLTRRTDRQQKQQQLSNNINIRSSNSADEWDMPLTANGNDALTWQQQSLGRKASNPTKKQQQGNKNGKKAGTFDKAEVEAIKPHTPSGISIMAPPQPAAAAARSLPASSHPTPIPTPAGAPLTWQQELFQRSGPSTPSSQLFSALEEGHSGAHPAKETRTRSSPTKNRSTHQKNAHLSDDGNLESSMSGLALNPSKKVVNVKQGKKANATAAPLAIPGSVPKHHHYTRSSAKQHHQRNPASDSDADNSVEEETANLSFGEEPSATPVTIAAEPSRPIAMAASPTKSSLYAGPKFHNSPSAGQLPTPRLAAFLNRNKESSPLPSGEVLAA